jgi:hypothetical protein
MWHYLVVGALGFIATLPAWLALVALVVWRDSRDGR